MKYCKEAIQCGGFTPRYQSHSTTKSANKSGEAELMRSCHNIYKGLEAKFYKDHRNIVV